jgi:hypothetical protein
MAKAFGLAGRLSTVAELPGRSNARHNREARTDVFVRPGSFHCAMTAGAAVSDQDSNDSIGARLRETPETLSTSTVPAPYRLRRGEIPFHGSARIRWFP